MIRLTRLVRVFPDSCEQHEEELPVEYNCSEAPGLCWPSPGTSTARKDCLPRYRYVDRSVQLRVSTGIRTARESG